MKTLFSKLKLSLILDFVRKLYVFHSDIVLSPRLARVTPAPLRQTTAWLMARDLLANEQRENDDSLR